MSSNKTLVIQRAMTRLGLSLATAESCTGGWIAKLFTDNSGSSLFFKGGVVTYSNAAKRKILGVRIRDDQSAVTPRVAVQMAKGALRLFNADVAVSTTGLMDPPQKGIAYVCVAVQRGKSITAKWERIILRDTRRQNRVSTSTAAVHLIEKTLNKGVQK